MPSTYGPRLQARPQRQARPAGVTILATLGVLGSLVTVMFTLIWLISLLRMSAEPSRQLAALAIALVAGLVVLWTNWGFWELIRWAWWTNMIVSLVTAVALVAGLGYVAQMVDVVGRIWRGVDAQQLSTGVLVALVVGIVYQLAAIVYMLGVHAVFKVGVKDERPLWERAHRN